MTLIETHIAEVPDLADPRRKRVTRFGTFSLRVCVALSLAACARGNKDPLLDFLPGATVVRSNPSCLDCSVSLQIVTDLAEAKDKDVITGELRSLIVTNEGVLVTNSTPGPPLLFAMDGRLKRQIGVARDTPNEFEFPSLLRGGILDTVLVLDERRRTITFLNMPLQSVRTIPIEGRVRDMALMGDGDLIVVMPVASGDSVRPLSRVSLRDGASSVLPNTAVKMPHGAAEEFADRIIAPSRDGLHFWSAHRLRYAVEKRKLNGELVQVFERDAEWFRPADRIAEVTPDAPPTARVVGLFEDSRGLLFIHSITADGRWHSALGGINGVDGKMRYVVHSPDLYKDTRVEVIDPESGKLVATAKFDPEYPTFSRGPYISRVVRGPLGWLVSEVSLVRLRGFSGLGG